MRDLIGHLVARKGAERGAARITIGISQEFPCAHDGAERAHAPSDDKSIRAGVVMMRVRSDDAATGSVGAGSPITIVYAGEDVLDPAALQIAGAFPGFGLFD